jgi:hypothetical protein
MKATTRRTLATVVVIAGLVSLAVAAAARTRWGGLLADVRAPTEGGPGHELRPAPNVPRPALHQPFVDPVFGTTLVRITDPSQVKGVNRVRHYYSKMNPFNADESRAILFGGDGGKVLYDTATWEPVKSLRVVSSDPEIQWHPSDPHLFYYMDFAGNSPNVRAMYRYDIRTDQRTLLRDFSEYDTARARLEGNLDREGRYYALLGYKGKQIEAFVYDLVKDRVSRRLPVTGKMADDWISVSQSGRYVVLMGGDRSRVYDIEMNHLRDLPDGSFGHADLCLTADGRDVMVYDGADHQLGPHRNVNMIDLASGKAIALVRIGWKSTPHVSCRNVDHPGWALISTQGPDSRYPNHDFEIFWVKLDPSAEVRRVAHHHSDRENGGYFAEQHAVTNRDGTKIVFASNWGDGPVASYLIDLGREGGRGAAARPR